MKQPREALVTQSAGNLASWNGLFGPGSPCFCCGAPLRTAAAEAARGILDTPELICPHCGAAVFDETTAAAEMVPGCRRDLAAA